ncbi:recombinase family protein [Cognatazoarcus halotolerans]|uniref:recombinase family protein n=1 Tax=Cognatazoarcus halotolerans TaxID=2686016 RepID=UPI00135CF51A|nr:recombinase family protein [Cognatazoarcus halotolerans]MBX3679411.1 recombinase family protein [Rhodocyclaceae bacterium]MCA8917370.1 recombinase family protein [Planctomycetota bacterium]
MDTPGSSSTTENRNARPLRCAVYTRTSREQEDGPTFSSIHSQQEACYAHIASRHHLSWLPASASYDDPGFSGATLERPALQQMLADIDAGRIDRVVVYKLDRLSRSLAYFAQLMARFERHRVALVSVTQHLNSEDAAGRLAINALISFAQFERENTGERIRDKARATRRQGMWTGSVPPMGYDADGQRLRVNEDEARVVRNIFERFVAQGSITALVKELGTQGVTTKVWVTRTGRSRGGRPVDKNDLYKLLNNQTLIGEMKSGDEWHVGVHEPIIPTDLWDRAHALLDARRRPQKRARGRLDDFLLKGLVFGTDGRAYSPWRSSVRNGRSYAYYVPQRKIAEGAGASDLPRCPASELEAVVVEHLRGQLRGPTSLLAHLPESARQHPRYDEAAVVAMLANIDAAWDLFLSGVQHELIQTLVERVTVGTDKVSISLDRDDVGRMVLDLLRG